MVESGDHLAVTCPACSPELVVRHEVVTNGGQPTVRCLDCHHVHSTTVDGGRATRTVRTVVSQGDESVSATIEVPTTLELETGQELVVETDAAAYSVEITGIEDHEGRRHDRLEATEVGTVWTRDIGNVAVNVTIHPPEGDRRSSRSATLRVPGDRTFEVGSIEDVDDEPVRISGIHLRAGASPEGDARKLDGMGAQANARDVKRLYGRSQRRIARSPW